MTNKDQKLTYKRNIENYLVELSRFCKRKPIEADLLSLEETENIRNSSRALTAVPPFRLTMGFDEKMEKRFLDFVEKLYQENPGAVYIWTPLTIACGTYELKSIFDFEFEANTEGIVVLLALDFSVNDLGQRVLDIDLVGENWKKVRYPTDLCGTP